MMTIKLKILGINYAWKNISHAKIANLKYQVQCGMNTLNYFMDHILYKIFNTIL